MSKLEVEPTDVSALRVTKPVEIGINDPALLSFPVRNIHDTNSAIVQYFQWKQSEKLRDKMLHEILW